MEEEQKNQEAAPPRPQWQIDFNNVCRELRYKMDGWMTYGFGRMEPSPFMMLALRSAQLSRMWMGRVLAAVGEAYPYPASSDPTSQAVEKPADTMEEFDDTIYRGFVEIRDCLAMSKFLRSLMGMAEEK